MSALTRGQGAAGSWGMGWEGWWEEIETQICETPAPSPGATQRGRTPSVLPQPALYKHVHFFVTF